MKYPLLPLCLLFIVFQAIGQANYDEDLVPQYTLPDLLVTKKGTQVNTSAKWTNIRRQEVLNLFEDHVYGKVPEFTYQTSYSERELPSTGLPENTLAKEVKISIFNSQDTIQMNMLIFLPAESQHPLPLFLGYNFHGNQTVHTNSHISVTSNYVINSSKLGISGNSVDESSRGIRTGRWPVDEILKRGYGLATIHCGDIDPDFDDGFENGIHSLLDKNQASQWPTISAWAWGLSQAMDYLQLDPKIDANAVAVIGHSRLGKAALWAGALDKRFALVISNNSGCGGAALSKRKYGETVKRINTSFPHWFCSNFKTYDDNENALPLDQHMLIALMAPRPVYVASADDDRWADPKGEYLSIYHAGAVYDLFGKGRFTNPQSPQANAPRIDGNLGYHIRTGGHDLTLYDWEKYLDFADIHLKK